jgi:subfamily B ATP-binding cassette protein HlyB/CyaB
MARSRSLHEYLGNLTSAVLLILGAKLVMQGDLTVGQLLAFHMMTSLIGSPLGRLSSLGQEYQQIKASLARFSEVVNAPAETQPSVRRLDLQPIKGDIRFERVCFSYAKEYGDVLQSVSLQIPAGEVLGVVGPTGSGKSTLAKLLLRFHIPQGGRVLIDGIDTASMPTRWLRRQIGIVPQETFLFRATIHANIALTMMHATREQVEAAAHLAGAHEFIGRLPDGYDTLVEERGVNLSGGEKQRIAIARALMGNPRILIFDEATSAVDHETERVIQERMREIVRGRTVLIIAHRLAALRNCDRIIAIEHGRITEQGTHEELLGVERGFYRRLWLQRT